MQVLANRPDIVREDYMNELCVLQDDVPPFPDEQASAWCPSAVLKRGAGGHPHSILAGLGWGAGQIPPFLSPHFASPTPSSSPPQAFALIESSLGRPLGEVFSSISERPVAAASLGQVRLLRLLAMRLPMRLLMLLATPPSRWLDCWAEPQRMVLLAGCEHCSS